MNLANQEIKKKLWMLASRICTLDIHQPEQDTHEPEQDTHKPTEK
jgi:hypothetical protein